MNPMQMKTPEERRAIAAKGLATRRARAAAEQALHEESVRKSSGLHQQVAELEEKLASLKRLETMNSVSAAIMGKALLRADEIVKAALPWSRSTGVYFLIDGDEVVYVGQAVNVYSRIDQHREKRFDRYAFVPCPRDALNRLESLYIHLLRPRLNGEQSNGAKCSPIALDELLGMTCEETP